MTIDLAFGDPQSVLASLARLFAIAQQSGTNESDRLKFVSEGLKGAVAVARGSQSVFVRELGGAAELVAAEADGSEKILTTLPLAAPLNNASNRKDVALEFLALLSEAVATGAAAAGAIRQNRSLISKLEAELDETNRGVVALYAELDDRAEKLRRADELKSRFLSYASHELRTPLNGIVGLVRLLRSASVERSSEDLRQLAFIQTAAEEMREMVNDLLDLAKVEAGKLEIQRSEFDLTFVFGALRGIFRPLLQSEDVVLLFEDTSAVPAIYSDETKVSQILRNLLSNALKFTERGSVRVWATAADHAVRIMVGDTGIGIPTEELSRIFDEFRQVQNPIQRKVRGTGLGLPLCRKLTDLLGGQLTVESTLGKGSVFTLILPLDHDSHKHAASPPILVRTKATLLIIDDVEIDRYLLTRLITAGGDYDIIQAEDGEVGFDVARREQPDLIFLDLNLPRSDGFAIAAMLKADPLTANIPIFVVTAEKLTSVDEDRLQTNTRGIIRKDELSDSQRVTIDLSGAAQVTLG